MLEISPVLAGKYDTPTYVPAVTNIADANAATDTDPVEASTGTASVDPRRFSQFDRTASQVGDATMSFGDFLDMVNPLQHIPVVSSLYRSVTGDTINPVSRIVGDIAYGAPLGLFTALANGVGAVADSIMESQTGHDVQGTVLAELFGSDKDAAGDKKVMLASADTTQSAAQGAAQQVAQNTTSTDTNANPPAEQLAQGFALNAANTSGKTGKQPYGGVMAPVQNLQQQNMSMALASAASTAGVRIGNKFYTNRFMTGPHPAPANIGAVTATSSATTATPAVNGSTPVAGGSTPVVNLQALTGSLPQASMPVAQASTPANTNAATTTPSAAAAAYAANAAATGNATMPTATTVEGVPTELRDDALILKALGLYQSVGARSTGAGNATIN